MNLNSNIDLFSFFDELQEPFILFSQKDSIRYNSFCRDNFGECPDDWRQFFVGIEIQKVINDFFDKVELPKIEFIHTNVKKSGEQVTIEWQIQRTSLENQHNWLIGKGNILSSQNLKSQEKNNLNLSLVNKIAKYNHDMVVILSKDGVFKFISDSVIENLGVNPEYIIGKSYLELIEKGFLELVEGDFEELLTSKKEIKIGMWLRLPEKDHFYLESYGKNLIYDSEVNGILLNTRDVTSFIEAEKSLNKRYELEKLINRISRKFVNAQLDQLDKVFNDSLRILGEFEKADRAYIFLFHEFKGEIEYAYEWIAEGIEPQIEKMKSVPINEHLITIKSLKEGNIFIIPDVAQMDELYAYERDIYLQQNIASVILIPFFSENSLMGFFGLDAVGKSRAWHEKDEYVLSQLGDIYAGTFNNRSIKKRLLRNENLLASTEILAKSGSWRFSNTKNKLFFSRGLNKIFGLEEDISSAPLGDLLKRIEKNERNILLENVNSAIKNKTSVSGEFSLNILGGNKYLSYTIEVRKISGYSNFEIYGYCTDITDKRDAEKYLKLQSQILAQVNDPIFVTDVHLRVIYMNKAASKEINQIENTKNDYKLTDLFEFQIAGDRDFNVLLENLEVGKEFREEIYLKTSKGVIEPYELSVKVFLNDLNEKLGYSFLIRNLSQQVKHEALAQKAKLIVENSSAVLFTVDPNQNFKIIFITENIKQYGYKADDLITSEASILDIIHPEDVQSIAKLHYSKKNKKGIPAFSGEYRLRRKDGTYRWVEDKTQEVLGPDGEAVLHEGIIQDITERKKDREEIIRSNKRYRVLAANIPLTNVFLINKDLRYIVAEGTNFANWGMTSKDFEGKTLEEIHKDNLHEIKPAVLRSLDNREFVQKFLICRNRVYEMTVRPIIYNGEVEYALGIVRDINEEYEAKENLKASEEKYRTLVEESTEIIFSLSTNLVLTYVSPNVKQFLGYDYQEVTKSKLTDYLHPDDFIVFSEIMNESTSGNIENHQYLEYRLKHKNGDYRVFSSNGRLLKDELGNIRHYTGIARDITKLKEAQRELFYAKEKAEQASMIKSQFLSIMSHEIRTPMNAVIGMAHLLIEENPRPDQLENLKTLQFSAENLLGLINDILDFNKIESGKIELENVAFDINIVFNRIIHSYTYQAREKSLEVSFDIDSSLPKVLMGDPVRLAQVANNLISNAIKFTEKGFVKIQLKKVSENKEYVKIRFEFKDSGIGIPEEKLQSIFEAFTQASAETTRKYGGTGLGLAIVKKLVELFGGEILVSRMKNGGSMFSFEIEFKKLEVNYFENKEDHVNIEKNLSHASILVAEDNLVNQIMIKKFLDKWGVKEIVMTNDGYEAIEAMESQDFDLILLDLQMPEKDGFEVGEYIRSHKNDKIRSLPIIALTASSLIEVKDQLDAIGINDYISKPFNPDNLYAKIIRYINV